MALTAGANSPFLAFPTIPFMGGVVVTGIDVVYSIGTANLTSLAVSLKRTRYTNGAVSSISDLLSPASAALPAAVTTNITVANVPVTGAPVVGAHENDPSGTDYFPDTVEWLELAAVNPGTSVLRVYYVFVYGNKVI
jgi:hypothetical protein